VEVHEEEKKEENNDESNKKLDLNLPKEFAKAIEERCPSDFLFGPVTLCHLESGFSAEQARTAVQEALQKSDFFVKDLFAHGFKVCVKGRTLKRASTI